MTNYDGNKLQESTMTAMYNDKIEEAIADRDTITKALADSVKDALKRHKQAGNPVVVMKDGRMVWLKPEDITVL